MEPREKVLAEIKRQVVELKIKPGELYDQDTGDAMGLTGGDWYDVGHVAVSLQRTYEAVLNQVLYGDQMQSASAIRDNVAGVLGRIESLRGWEAASKEFFEAYSECCYRCKKKRAVEEARKRLAPVVSQDEGR